ncbi:MAG: hypothetical protein NT169_17120 [Chloroflexi bacterium]|nr:hypothetical protein [Chloroflexota bacterium]
MRELSSLREGWDTFQEEETRLLRAMTVQESMRQWLMLQEAFEYQLLQTTALFAPERRAALAELQARLQRLAEWGQEHGKTASVSPDTAAAFG